MFGSMRPGIRSLVVLGALVATAIGCRRHDGERHEHHGSHDEHHDEGPAEDEGVPPPSRHLGEMMAEVGRRLERSGRSVAAGRWELAAYDVGELEEVFEGEIAVVVTPEDVPLDVGKVAAGFARTQLPVLERAIESRDRAAFEQAFAQTAEGCNSCHRAANHGYIEVPTAIGEGIPRLGPLDAGTAPASP